MVKFSVGLAECVRGGKPRAVAIFHCCEPCRTGQCGKACHHGELDGRELDPADISWKHAGCMCWVAIEPKR